MIIKGSPILHARTYNIDFRTGKLLVCPRFFDKSEAKFCHRVAKDSTIFFELAPLEGRTVVYGNGKYLIVGKTVVFDDLYKRCGLPAKYIRVDNPNGRLAYGFVGAAFALKDISAPFEFPEKTILKIYEHCIADRWDETEGSSGARESTLSDPIELEVEELKHTDRDMTNLLKDIGRKLAIEDTPENCDNIICYVEQHARHGKKISLCTSLDTTKAIGESCFDIVTCRGAQSIRLRADTDVSGTRGRGDERYAINTKEFISQVLTEASISTSSSHGRIKSLEEIINSSDPPKSDSDSRDDSFSWQKKNEGARARIPSYSSGSVQSECSWLELSSLLQNISCEKLLRLILRVLRMNNKVATPPHKIIFVCAWNTCRSAMAEYIMRHLLNKAGLADKIQVDSAGCLTEGGEPIGGRTGRTLAQNHVPFGEHLSKRFTYEHYVAFDLVIALDEGVLQYLRLKFGNSDNKIHLFRDDDGRELSIADPGFRGEHDLVYATILRGCEVLLREISIP